MKKSTATLTDTGERMVPEFHKERLMYAEHQTRYMSAQDIVKDKVVLDIACGSGYGTKLLAEKAKKVYGVDVEPDAVAYAKEHFGGPNIVHQVGSAVDIPLEDNSVDVVITFETIEHIDDYKKFVKEIKRVLKSDGLAIVSTPNDLEFAEGNHYHLHEFELNELKDLLSTEFKNIDDYFQATWKYVAMGSRDILEKEGPLDIETINMAPLSLTKCLYFYLLCSNRKITETVKPLAALGEHYSDRTLIGQDYAHKIQLEQMQQSEANLREQITSLHEQLETRRQELEGKEHEIEAIKGSKSYKLARKLANIKKRVIE